MPTPATIGPNPGSEWWLQRAIKRSKRTAGIQLPFAFVRRENYGSSDAALARMIRGGRGGEVRLKVYLCLTLIAAAAPYRIDGIPSRAWAAMIGLPDPDDAGARRVSDGLNWLASEKLIRVERQAGAPSAVTLLNPAGDGLPYKRPSKRWVTLPIGYWEKQWITALSGTATALLIVLLDLQGGRSGPQNAIWVTGERRVQYGLSDDTWTRGTRELKECGLLSVHRAPQGRVFDWRRMRNTYWIDKDRLQEPPTVRVQND